MDREYAIVKIEILHPQIYALKEAKPAAVEQFDHKIVRMFEMLQNRVDLPPGKNDRDISGFLGAGNILVLAKILFQNMTVEK